MRTISIRARLKDQDGNFLDDTIESNQVLFDVVGFGAGDVFDISASGLGKTVTDVVTAGPDGSASSTFTVTDQSLLPLLTLFYSASWSNIGDETRWESASSVANIVITKR